MSGFNSVKIILSCPFVHFELKTKPNVSSSDFLSKNRIENGFKTNFFVLDSSAEFIEV